MQLETESPLANTAAGLLSPFLLQKRLVYSQIFAQLKTKYTNEHEIEECMNDHDHDNADDDMI